MLRKVAAYVLVVLLVPTAIYLGIAACDLWLGGEEDEPGPAITPDGETQLVTTYLVPGPSPWLLGGVALVCVGAIVVLLRRTPRNDRE